MTGTIQSVHPDRFVMRIQVNSNGAGAQVFAVKVYADDFGKHVWNLAQTLAATPGPHHDSLCLPLAYLTQERTLVFPWIAGEFLSDIVDARKPVRDLGDVLHPHERVERTRDEVRRRHGPRTRRGTLSGREPLDRTPDGGRGLGERLVFTLAETPLEPQHGARELRLAREAGRALERMHGATGRLERRLSGLMGGKIQDQRVGLVEPLSRKQPRIPGSENEGLQVLAALDRNLRELLGQKGPGAFSSVARAAKLSLEVGVQQQSRGFLRDFEIWVPGKDTRKVAGVLRPHR